jgi:hypothetical protein
MLENTGFADIELVNETGFNSSPKTKGVLIRAKKSSQPCHKEAKHLLESKVESPDSSIPINEWNPRGAKLEDVLTKAFELGAEKAKIIDTNTVVIEKWVLWKCRYGCNLYKKDAYHPPLAPDVESTKEVIQEYSKAILINGSKGKKLTEIAVRLEGEAYNMGYYKAFALTSLSSGPAGAT